MSIDPDKTQPAASGKCPCHGVTLERFIRPAVLMVLAQGSQYGYRIVQQLAETPGFGGQKPNTAGVYRCLKLMAEEGSIVPSWELSESGPAKRRYTLSPAGEACLANWLETLAAYRQSIDELLAFGRSIMEAKRTR
jgi:DNA-binding PadR family transcriptional regulator